MNRDEVSELIQGIIMDHGVPQSIRTTLEESLSLLNSMQEDQEKICHLISVLDDASENPNLSMNARTHIWSIVSALEGEMCKK